MLLQVEVGEYVVTWPASNKYIYTYMYVMIVNPKPTTSKQSTLKMEKSLLWDPDQSPPYRLPGLTLLPVSALGKLPKRLGSRVKVNQRGLRVLQWWGQLVYLRHTDKLCTRSHDVNVRVCQITFCSSLLSAADYRLHGCSIGSMHWIHIGPGAAERYL